jgi:ferrous iron transport protein A
MKTTASVRGRDTMTVKLLSELAVGEKGKIVRVEGGGGIGRRITDMGAVPGTGVEVVRVAPLGDPIEVKLKNYNLSLRKTEAQRIKIEVA